MECGPNYPREPPVIYFVSQINLPGVNQQNGLVDKNFVGILRDWERISTELSRNLRPKDDPLSLESALIAIRKSVRCMELKGFETNQFSRYMDEHKKLQQPPEGSKYAIYKD